MFHWKRTKFVLFQVKDLIKNYRQIQALKSFVHVYEENFVARIERIESSCPWTLINEQFLQID